MRPRKKDRHLPACMYLKHGSYWYVKKNKWRALGKDYQEALLEYARITSASGQTGMPALIDKVLIELEKTHKHNTMQQYRLAAERCKVVFQEFEPHQVLPKHIAALKISMSDSPSMANRIISFMRTVFRLALEWQQVDINPCIGVRPYPEKARTRYITDAELTAVLDQCEPYMQRILLMAYLTGQRIGDVLAIKMADVTERGIFFEQQKTGARLIVAMTPDLQRLLSDIHESRADNSSAWLFTSQRGGGKAVHYSTVKGAFALARKAAGVDDVTIHDIRAKSLTDAKKQGLNAQALGGHTDARMTARYIRSREIDVAHPPTLPV